MSAILPNYTGPYISDGKVQSSVEFGETAPQDQLDALSRLHDSAYAKWDDWQHRQAADEIYEIEAKKLAGKFPQLAGKIVAYGNFAARSSATLAQRTASLGPLGILVGGIENMVKLHDYVTNGDRYKADVRTYFGTDPHPEFQGGGNIMQASAETPRGLYDPVVDIKGYNPAKFDKPTQDFQKSKANANSGATGNAAAGATSAVGVVASTKPLDKIPNNRLVPISRPPTLPQDVSFFDKPGHAQRSATKLRSIKRKKRRKQL